MLRLQPNSCLERSLVLQCWLAAHGEPYEVIVGVASDQQVKAHAWLPFEAGTRTSDFVEIKRVPVRVG